MAGTPCIATLTLNPAIDKTAHSESFHTGKVNRVSSEHSDVGGKGVNVAAFLAQYGYPVTATGLLGVENAEPFGHLFAEIGIEDRFIRVPGTTRVNIKIVDKIREFVTEVNFPGISADADSIAEVRETALTLAKEGIEWFVLSGSLPSGVPTEIYRDLTEQLKEKGCKVVVDASGIPFDRALAAAPHVVKPNIDELQEILGAPLESAAEIVSAARGLGGGEIGLVVVSMRDRGAVFVTQEEAVLAVPPRARIVTTVGAGDAMVAGIVHGLATGLPLGELARLSTAFSLGALGQLGPILPPKEDINAFAELVEVSEIGRE